MKNAYYVKVGYNNYYVSVNVILFEKFRNTKFAGTDLLWVEFYVNTNIVEETTKVVSKCCIQHWYVSPVHKSTVYFKSKHTYFHGQYVRRIYWIMPSWLFVINRPAIWD